MFISMDEIGVVRVVKVRVYSVYSYIEPTCDVLFTNEISILSIRVILALHNVNATTALSNNNGPHS